MKSSRRDGADSNVRDERVALVHRGRRVVGDDGGHQDGEQLRAAWRNEKRNERGRGKSGKDREKEDENKQKKTKQKRNKKNKIRYITRTARVDLSDEAGCKGKVAKRVRYITRTVLDEVSSSKKTKMRWIESDI